MTGRERRENERQTDKDTEREREREREINDLLGCLLRFFCSILFLSLFVEGERLLLK